MPDNQNAVATTQQEPVKADWAALQEDFSEVITQNQPINNEKPDPSTVDNANQEETQDANLDTEKKTDEAQKTDENQKTDDEKEKTDNPESKKDDKDQSKEETKQDESEEDIFKPEDIKDVPKQYEEGSWGELGKDLGLELTEDSHEAFISKIKENYVPKSEYEKAVSLNLDSIYAGLKNPETAVAFKLMEMGIPEDKVFAPTKEIDGYLALGDVELVRADLSLRAEEGWTPELIDAKMEELAGDPKKLALAAGELRIELNNNKKQITETRTKLLQQYEQQKQNVILQQKAQEQAQFNEALDKLQTFMGKPVSKEAKEAIRAKHNSGLYNDVVNAADSKVAAIMYKEYGEKLAKLIQNKASEEAKTETRKKLLNIPPVNSGAGKRVDTNATNQSDNNWAALSDFKN